MKIPIFLISPPSLDPHKINNPIDELINPGDIELDDLFAT